MTLLILLTISYALGCLTPGYYLVRSDWQAQWIGFPPTNSAQSEFERVLVLDGCAWVWAHGATTGNQPQGRVYFRKLL